MGQEGGRKKEGNQGCNQRYIWGRKEEGRRRVIKDVIKDIFGTGRKKEGNQGCNQRYIWDRNEEGSRRMDI